MTVETNGAAETMALAGKLAAAARAGDVFGLTGGLGAGKTAFCQGFAAALGFEGRAASPTFGLIHEYGGVLPVYHFDMYRIKSVKELEDIGGDEYFYGSGVCLVEWADIVREALPDGTIWINIVKTGESSRRITIDGINGRIGSGD
jgi:tRNA threonylcarbamoyladenosine biosynthesis protein TsaE